MSDNRIAFSSPTWVWCLNDYLVLSLKKKTVHSCFLAGQTWNETNGETLQLSNWRRQQAKKVHFLILNFQNRKQQQVTSGNTWSWCWFQCFLIAETALLYLLRIHQLIHQSCSSHINTLPMETSTPAPAVARNALDNRSQATQPC